MPSYSKPVLEREDEKRSCHGEFQAGRTSKNNNQSLSRDREEIKRSAPRDKRGNDGEGTFRGLLHNNPDVIPTGGQPIYTHTTTGPQPGFQFATPPVTTPSYNPQPGGYYPVFPSSHNGYTFNSAIPAVSYSTYGQPTTYYNMADNPGQYAHREPPCYGVHFQPQVPDTTSGPYLHSYIPRHDAGGAYVVHPGIPGYPPVAVSL
jgi:hypothetical protein